MPHFTVDDLSSERTLRRRMKERHQQMIDSNEFVEFIQYMKFGGCLSFDFGIHSGQNFLTIFGHIINEQLWVLISENIKLYSFNFK